MRLPEGEATVSRTLRLPSLVTGADQGERCHLLQPGSGPASPET
jgi:hypothetical protein